MTDRIYLDNAATSWPKRQSVIEAAFDFITQCGATAGRGTYQSAMESERWLSEARFQLARLIGAGQSSSIAFCSSGTHALNAVLKGLVRDRQHVIASQIEHNSVLRPLMQLVREKGVQVEFAQSDACGVASLAHAKELLRPETRWIVIGHASNVTGAIQDLNAWKQLADQSNARLIVDASQTMGYIPIDVRESAIGVLAAAGHKGLGGFSGTGFVYALPELQAEFHPLMTGGTGMHSESMESPTNWPQVIEVGNHNLPGIVSMAVAAKELFDEARFSPIAWQTGWRQVMHRLVSGLRDIPGVRLVGYPSEHTLPAEAPESNEGKVTLDRVPLVSIQVEGWDAHQLAMVLDSDFGIEVRAGLHCAALVHDAIGSRETGGTLRISPGHGTRQEHLQAFLSALRQIVADSPS